MWRQGALLLLFALSAGSAAAQDHRYYRAPNTRAYAYDPAYGGSGRGRWEDHGYAYQYGYRDGVRQARHDLEHHRPFRPERNDRFEDADHGYHHDWGPKGAYKQEYREGFLRGYQDVYNGRRY